MTFLLAGGALPIAALGLGVAVLVCVQTARGTAHGLSSTPWRVTAALLWIAGILGVLYLTLFLANPNGGGVNLRPLASIRLELHRHNLGMAAFNLLGNLALLVPFGLLARPAWRWGWPTTTLAAAIFCTGIECVQALTGRSADIDDILLNTTGAFLASVFTAALFAVAGQVHRYRLRQDDLVTAA